MHITVCSLLPLQALCSISPFIKPKLKCLVSRLAPAGPRTIPCCPSGDALSHFCKDTDVTAVAACEPQQSYAKPCWFMFNLRSAGSAEASPPSSWANAPYQWLRNTPPMPLPLLHLKKYKFSTVQKGIITISENTNVNLMLHIMALTAPRLLWYGVKEALQANAKC